jgi:hypothetical protein
MQLGYFSSIFFTAPNLGFVGAAFLAVMQTPQRYAASILLRC